MSAGRSFTAARRGVTDIPDIIADAAWQGLEPEASGGDGVKTLVSRDRHTRGRFSQIHDAAARAAPRPPRRV